MIAVVQRVSSAAVAVAEGPGAPHRAEIGPGLVALVGCGHGDSAREAEWLADKLAALRVFPDAAGRMNLSVKEAGGGVLVVSQFTLLGDASKGNRPSFAGAAPPDEARPLVAMVASRLRSEHGLTVGEGVFGAAMQVSLVNEGPVTIIVERRAGA